MISGLSKSIKQFSGQLKSSEGTLWGKVEVLWDDPTRIPYEIDKIIFLEHEFTQKDGTLVLKGRRFVDEEKEAKFFLVTKIKNILAVSLLIEKAKHVFEL